MSEHAVTVGWERGGRDFTYEAYSRDHEWVFDGGTTVQASAAPAYRGSPARVDPEEAFVAAISSCHMLTFLAVAAKQGFVIDQYTDRAVGFLEKTPRGPLGITRVILRPEIEFSGDRRPSRKELTEMHDKAHHACFIANSVDTAITVEETAAV